MLTPDPIVAGADALAAIKTYLRIVETDDDTALAALAIAAVAACEAFTGRVLVARGFVETVTPAFGWCPLSAWPVASIATVTAPDGTALAVGDYAVDIDTSGTGWVRRGAAGAERLRVTYRAGLASGWSDIAEPLRQGMLAFAADRYAARDRMIDTALQPAIAALWRTQRRMRI